MKVNFNNLRLRTLKAHDRLVGILNGAIVPEDQMITVEQPDNAPSHFLHGGVVLDVNDIEEVLNDLRQYIGSIASVYQEGDPEFKDVFSEHYPEGKSMAIFNPEPDEDNG